ncbi:MAG: exodeoxyribonuclease VII large subunit, partial [Halioglobus sp.]|nr:exodeoxyribonuclease VII large subunit [Halioglobus sp.]
EQVAAAIELANRAVAAGAVSLDALIVGRGGGSLEDLWAFNEEVVARAIAHSELPIVSAVGHEVDFSIADFVADRRAPTPSAAAELLSPDRDEWLQVLEGTRYTLLQQVNQKLGHLGQELRHLRRRLRHPGSLLREQAQRVDDLEQRLRRAQAGILLQSRNHHAMLGNRLRAQSPLMRVQQLQRSHADTRRRLLSAMQQNLAGTRQRAAALAQVLDSLSPLGVLGRGFAVLRDDRGNIVSDAAAVRVGDEVSARLARGQLDLTVTRVVPGEDQGQD